MRHIDFYDFDFNESNDNPSKIKDKEYQGQD